MDQQTGHWQRGQQSTDGRWWWDGQVWQPVQPAGATIRFTPGRPGPAGSRRPAVAALILGIASLVVWLVPIAGVVVGAVALGLGVNASGGPERPKAITGVVMGSIGFGAIRPQLRRGHVPESPVDPPAPDRRKGQGP